MQFSSLVPTHESLGTRLAVFKLCAKTQLYEGDMARLTLAVTSLLCFLIYSVHASKLLHAFMSVLHQGLLIIYVSTVVAAPGRDKRQNSLFGNCAPSCGNQIRLSDGCSGTLEVLSRGGRYGTATDRNFGVNEATVVCRQLGCLRDNIQPVRVNTRE